MKTKKIKIEFTVDVDVDAWVENYGTDPKDVVRDVKAYANVTIVEQFLQIGVLVPSRWGEDVYC